jgi:hypothetical protein
MTQGTDICGNDLCTTTPNYCSKELMELITISQDPHNSDTLTFKIQTNLNVNINYKVIYFLIFLILANGK